MSELKLITPRRNFRVSGLLRLGGGAELHRRSPVQGHVHVARKGVSRAILDHDLRVERRQSPMVHRRPRLENPATRCASPGLKRFPCVQKCAQAGLSLAIFGTTLGTQACNTTQALFLDRAFTCPVFF
jgi:hypothetical protein